MAEAGVFEGHNLRNKDRFPDSFVNISYDNGCCETAR